MTDLEYINSKFGTEYTSMEEVNWRDITTNFFFIDRQKYYDNLKKKSIIDEEFISIMEKYTEEICQKAPYKGVSPFWFNISKYYRLSDDFVHRFQDKLNWRIVSTYQRLSEDFIRQYQDKVVWENIFIYQVLSEGFRQEFKHKLR